MLPALSTIIAAYVFFRMIEVLFFAQTRYSGKAQHVIVAVLAFLVMGVTALCMFAIWSAGLQSTPAFGR